jgi:hypothetical protein
VVVDHDTGRLVWLETAIREKCATYSIQGAVTVVTADFRRDADLFHASERWLPRKGSTCQTSKGKTRSNIPKWATTEVSRLLLECCGFVES